MVKMCGESTLEPLYMIYEKCLVTGSSLLSGIELMLLQFTKKAADNPNEIIVLSLYCLSLEKSLKKLFLKQSIAIFVTMTY